MRAWLLVVGLSLFTASAWAAAPLTFLAPHTEAVDGANTFPAGSYVPEDPFSTPYGCPGTSSDFIGESATFAYFVADPLFQTFFLPPGGCMDVRDFWVAWDEDNLYLAVGGPNELFERGDLFIAIDTDDNTGPGVDLPTAPWAKRVDFCGWDPEFFLAVESPASVGGFAALLDQGGNPIFTTDDGLPAADGGYVSCDAGGMYYEFAVPLGLLGLSVSDTGQPVNFAIYTTFEDDGYDVYDTGPGCGQPDVHEQVGDTPFDGDHCDLEVDCVRGVPDISCGFAESDDGLGAGNPVGDRVPSSDNSDADVDTIEEYYSIVNVGQIRPVPTEPTTWGRVKSIYR